MTNIEQDWRELPAGDELDRLIAERCGDLATEPVQRCYSRDTDAALSLLPDNLGSVSIMRVDGGAWLVHCNTLSSRLADHWMGEGETIALAVARAYLNWTDKNAGE